jgi:hypothetical protein
VSSSISLRFYHQLYCHLYCCYQPSSTVKYGVFEHGVFEHDVSSWDVFEYDVFQYGVFQCGVCTARSVESNTT